MIPEEVLNAVKEIQIEKMKYLSRGPHQIKLLLYRVNYGDS